MSDSHGIDMTIAVDSASLARAFGDELPWLTDRQLQTLMWIADFWTANRHAPTHREIAAGLGGSQRTGTAAPFVNPLIAKGYLERTDAGLRNLRLTERAARKVAFVRAGAEALPMT